MLLITFVFLISLLVLLGTYPAVALKLYKQGRSVGLYNNRLKAGTVPRQAAGHASATEAANKTATQAKTAAASKRAMHIQALKIYTSIFLAFVVAYLMFVVSAVSLSMWPGYGYYINHTANPVIYFCFVEKFRNSVKEYWRRLPCL